MEDDIRKLIIDLVHEYHEEKYEEMDSIYRLIKELYNSMYSVNVRFMQQMDEIEKLINAHAIDVQNVYNSIQDLRDKYSNLTKKSKSYRKILDLMEEIRKPENIELLKILSSLDYTLLQNISYASEYLNDLEKIKKIFKT